MITCELPASDSNEGLGKPGQDIMSFCGHFPDLWKSISVRSLVCKASKDLFNIVGSIRLCYEGSSEPRDPIKLGKHFVILDESIPFENLSNLLISLAGGLYETSIGSVLNAAAVTPDIKPLNSFVFGFHQSRSQYSGVDYSHALLSSEGGERLYNIASQIGIDTDIIDAELRKPVEGFYENLDDFVQTHLLAPWRTKGFPVRNVFLDIVAPLPWRLTQARDADTGEITPAVESPVNLVCPNIRVMSVVKEESGLERRPVTLLAKEEAQKCGDLFVWRVDLNDISKVGAARLTLLSDYKDPLDAIRYERQEDVPPFQPEETPTDTPNETSRASNLHQARFWLRMLARYLGASRGIPGFGDIVPKIYKNEGKQIAEIVRVAIDRILARGDLSGYATGVIEDPIAHAKWSEDAINALNDYLPWLPKYENSGFSMEMLLAHLEGKPYFGYDARDPEWIPSSKTVADRIPLEIRKWILVSIETQIYSQHKTTIAALGRLPTGFPDILERYKSTEVSKQRINHLWSALDKYEERIEMTSSRIANDSTSDAPAMPGKARLDRDPFPKVLGKQGSSEAAMQRFNVGIITIKEDEYDAILDKFKPTTTERGKYRDYDVAVIETSYGSCRTAITRCMHQGNTYAQTAAVEMLADIYPEFVLVVGIAGGIPTPDFCLGDVIVSEYIHDLTLEDTGTAPAKRSFNALGGYLHPSASRIVERLRAIERATSSWNSEESIGCRRPGLGGSHTTEDASWNADIDEALEKHAQNEKPKATARKIASSDRLVKDPELISDWRTVLKAVAAVEMESAGAYSACQRQNVPFLAIRGISDIIGWKRNEAWTLYACHSAASYARLLIKSGIFMPPTGRSG